MKVFYELSKMKSTDRKPTEEEYKRHFKKEEINKAKKLFTIYDPIEKVFKG